MRKPGGENKAAYLEDVQIIQRYAEWNRQIIVREILKEMKGIYSSCVGTDTLDEAPSAYRSIKEIAGQIKDTVEITEILKPVYNFKAGSRKSRRQYKLMPHGGSIPALSEGIRCGFMWGRSLF